MPAWWDKLGLGPIVENTVAYNPAGTAVNLFVITGGRILLTSLVGQVTVIIAQNAAANANSRLRHTPTTGAAAATNMCLDLDCDGFDVDNALHITGDPGVAMVDDGETGVIIPSFVTNLLVLQPGTISLFYTTLVTGTVRWTIKYLAIDAASLVVAA